MQAPDFKLDPGGYVHWVQSTRQAPVSPRVPLHLGCAVVGSVARSLLAFLDGADRNLGWTLLQGRQGHEVHLPGDPSLAFAALRHALHQHRAASWPQAEQLPLMDEHGQVHGSVPRDLARILGVNTHSVHLVGWQGEGCWVQERAASKSEDPGRLDTLVGGTVGWGEDPLATLERETWEEAGLKLQQLQGLTSHGATMLRYPSLEANGWGYQLETVHCFSAQVVPGVRPANNDSEVAAFHHLGRAALSRALAADRFTLAAAGAFYSLTL